jgi:putative aminopeptidase FrvX
MDKIELLLKELSETFGIGGHEGAVAKIMERELKDHVDKISSDKLGSFIAEKVGDAKGPRIMFAAHMDEVGFIVSKVSKEGFISFIPVGGWWGHIVLGQKVTIKTRKGDVVGMIGAKPPHILKDEERKKLVDIEDMFIDVGATKDFNVDKKLDIRPGDPIVPIAPFEIMANKKLYLGKAWDDRLGCAVIIEVLRKLAGTKHPNIVYGVGTVQEEVGLRGAMTSANMVNPDVGFAIDVNIAQDTPGLKNDQPEKLGAGVSILIYDSSMIPNAKLRDLVVETARKNKIKCHFSSLWRGGTDAGRIHVNRIGVPSLFMGIATRYIHGHYGIFSRDDFDSMVKLIVEIVRKLDRKTVENLTKW